MPTDGGEILYFAYGSNLDLKRIKQRMGKIPPFQRARLPGYRLAFNKRASGGGVYANIVREAREEVWGVIYQCTHQEIEVLDRYEGVAGGHYRQVCVDVELENSEVVGAITYVAGDAFVCPEGRPSQEYLRHIVDGARKHGLPEQYVKSIEALTRGHDSTG